MGKSASMSKCVCGASKPRSEEKCAFCVAKKKIGRKWHMSDSSLENEIARWNRNEDRYDEESYA